MKVDSSKHERTKFCGENNKNSNDYIEGRAAQVRPANFFVEIRLSTYQSRGNGDLQSRWVDVYQLHFEDAHVVVHLLRLP